MELVSKIDEWGKGAWILLMIGGFILFWPIGLAILAYLLWSGRMGCRHTHWSTDMNEDWETRREEWRARKHEFRQMKRAMRDDIRAYWHGMRGRKGTGAAMRSSGNAAFDDYKAETLRRLEEEQAEFGEFLDNLRKARDKAEFDQFMQGRRNAQSINRGVDDPDPHYRPREDGDRSADN